MHDPIDPASLLIGALGGAGMTLLLTFVAAGVTVWRQGWSEGTPIQGEGIERAKRRGDL